jgi:hypothetical protein
MAVDASSSDSPPKPATTPAGTISVSRASAVVSP